MHPWWPWGPPRKYRKDIAFNLFLHVSTIFHVCSLAAVHHVQMFATSSLIFHGFYSELGIIRCLSRGIWLKKTSTLSDHFNRSTMAFGPRERGFLTSIKGGIALSGRLWSSCGTFVNFFDMFRRNVGSIRGEMGKSIWWTMPKSWWRFNLHSETLDMLGLSLNMPLNCGPAGVTGTSQNQRTSYTLIIIIHISACFWRCRMM